MKQFPKEMWDFKSELNPWSIHNIIVHITDSEANSYIRCRRFIAEPGQHNALPVTAIDEASGGVARPGPTAEDALRRLPRDTGPARVLICGSLYLAGEILKLDAG